MYLATWLDRRSSQVVGWDLRDTLPEGLVSEALRRALAVRQPGSPSTPTKAASAGLLDLKP